MSIFLSGGADSLTLLAPTSAHPQYAQLAARRSRCPQAQGTPLAEDPSLRWHPVARAALAELYGEGKVTVMPAIGYDDANQSHFTSRHFWEVGETNPFGRWGWLGRYLDHHGVADNPLQGLTLGWDLQPALAAQRRAGGDRGASRTTTTSGRPASGDTVAGQDARRLRRPRRARHERRRAWPRRARAVAATGRLRDQLAPFQDGFTTPAGVTYPTRRASPDGCARSRR